MLEITPPSLNEISGSSRDPGIREVRDSLNEISGYPEKNGSQGCQKTICFHRVLRCRGSRSENIVIHNRNGVPFCNLAKKVIRFHWKTKVFQNAILTFHFLNFSHGETSFSGSRESRSENIVKHNETESFFVVLPRKCSVSIGKQMCFRARF